MPSIDNCRLEQDVQTLYPLIGLPHFIQIESGRNGKLLRQLAQIKSPVFPHPIHRFGKKKSTILLVQRLIGNFTNALVFCVQVKVAVVGQYD